MLMGLTLLINAELHIGLCELILLYTFLGELPPMIMTGSDGRVVVCRLDYKFFESTAS